MRFSKVTQVINDIRKGKIVIVIDDADRENEGDFIMAAQHATPEKVNFMAKHGRGIICVPMAAERLDALGIGMMASEFSGDPFRTAWAISIDAKKGITTGISAHDRSRTIRLLADPKSKLKDFVRPGHIFPLRAREGGVLVRAGHTEACVDLVGLAKLNTGGVICEIMNDDGTMARTPDLIRLAKQKRMKICTIRDLIEFRRKREKLVNCVAQTGFKTAFGQFKLMVYESIVDKDLHFALVRGEAQSASSVLVRVHAASLVDDVFKQMPNGSVHNELEAAMSMIAKERCGIVLYMRQGDHGTELLKKLKINEFTPGMQNGTADKKQSAAPDLRQYGIGAEILADLGVRRIKLLTNHPRKVVGLEAYGMKIVKCVPISKRALSTQRRGVKGQKLARH